MLWLSTFMKPRLSFFRSFQALGNVMLVSFYTPSTRFPVGPALALCLNLSSFPISSWPSQVFQVP